MYHNNVLLIVMLLIIYMKMSVNNMHFQILSYDIPCEPNRITKIGALMG